MRFGIALFLVLILWSCGKKEVRQQTSETVDPTTILQDADSYFTEGDYENAFRAYGLIYYNYPNSREYIDGALGLSRTYAELENYEKGFDILYNLLKENLIPSRVPQIYNEVARFYENSAGISEQLTGAGSGDYEKAISYYQKSLDYPNSEDGNARGFAQYKIGVLNERLDRYAKALSAYEATINTYGTSSWAPQAESQIAGLREKLQRRADYQSEGLLPDSTVQTPSPFNTPSDSTSSLAVPDFMTPDSMAQDTTKR